MEITFKPTIKQFITWEYLNDKTTTEVLFGGAAGGAKSYLGCAWLIISCMAYPRTRWLMGRSKLNILRNTTLKTFKDIVSSWGLNSEININYQSNTIYFLNGSEIIMKDLFYYPSDADFDSLGSLEITGAFIDEVSQVSHKAFEVVNTRIRYKLAEYNLIPKILMSCNPSKGWLYGEFYKPSLDGTIKEYRKYVSALPGDNPYIDPNYVIQLRKASRAIQQRLLFGNWDYSDDIDSLFRYTDLLNMRRVPLDEDGEFYLTCDIARLGKDSTLLIVWKGLTIMEIIQLEGVTTDISAAKIGDICRRWNIPMRNVIIDGDGLGVGVIDQLKGVVSFINGSRAIESGGKPTNYQNLKSQCYYLLAEYIERGKISLSSNISNETFEALCQELGVIKQKDIDGDGKLMVIPKDVMKRILGRSPDIADSVMFRMWYELKNTPNRTFSVGSGKRW